MKVLQVLAGAILLASLAACETTGSYTLDANGNVSGSSSGASQSGSSNYAAVPYGGSGSGELTATGYATIDDQPGESAALRRLMAIRVAKLDAYRILAAQVYGQYIDASTSIGDITMTDENFEARVRGVIYDAKLERIKPVGGDTYEVTLSLPRSSVYDLRRLYLQSVAISHR
ncbi:hypothetical protein N9Y68_07670 [Luminiphilus sp.]|nr:hypothetical protein [Luminiphilus sp.]